MKIVQERFDTDEYVDLVISREEAEMILDSFVLAMPVKMGDKIVSLGIRLNEDEE